MSWTKYLNPLNDLNNGEVSNTDPNDPNNPNWQGTGLTKAAYYAALAGAGQNEQASATAAGNTAATTAQNDPNNTTANPIPAGMTKDQYYAALAAGGQNASAAASAAGNVAANTAFATDPNNSSNPTSIAAGGGGDPTNTGPLSGPGPYEQWAAANSGAFDKPSASEQLYSEGMAGTDPYYQYATDKSTQAINDASAARGNWNSSATLYDIGNQTANLRGQQASGMKDEAAASDAAYNSRTTGAENLYSQWQNAQEGRLGGAQSSATTLGADQANVVTNAYKSAGDLSNKDNLEAFNAQLQKLGIDPTSQAVQDLIKSLGAGAAVVAAA